MRENGWGEPANNKPEQDGKDGYPHPNTDREKIEEDKGERWEEELARFDSGHLFYRELTRPGLSPTRVD